MLKIRKAGGTSSPPDDAIGLPRVIRMRNAELLLLSV